MNSNTSFIDYLFSLYLSRLSFFHQGWGDFDLLKKIESVGVSPASPRKIDISWSKDFEKDQLIFRYGTFKTPYQEIPLPREVNLAHVEFVLPKGISNPPVCIHFAATGDEGFGLRRRGMAIPLAKKGIASLILENPYYGYRRPPGQEKYKLKQVADLGLMVIAAVQEGRALVSWLKQNQYKKIGLTGISMGGYAAALVASQVRQPLAVVSCLPAHSAETVFLEGAMRKACHWDVLQKQLGKNRNVKRRLKKFFKMSDLRNYSIPFSPSTTILVAAKEDAIVPYYSSQLLHQHWKGSELRMINAGHVSGFLFYRNVFQSAIIDAFGKL